MRYPQILIYENDGSIAQHLKAEAQEKKWKCSVREPRQADACIRLLRRGGDGVLILKVGRNLSDELELLERVHRLFPDARPVVVCDRDERQVSELAWELGAACVVLASQAREQLPEIVYGLLPKSSSDQGRRTDET